MRREGRRIDDVLAHISPAHSENVNFFGAIEFDIDAELARLGPTGYHRCACVTRCSERPWAVMGTLSLVAGSEAVMGGCASRLR